MENKRYIKVSADPIEIKEEDMTMRFDFYLRKSFPKSLREKGRIKWKTVGWLCFIWVMFIAVTWLGVHRAKSLKQSFSESWSVFMLAGLRKIRSGHPSDVLRYHRTLGTLRS